MLSLIKRHGVLPSVGMRRALPWRPAAFAVVFLVALAAVNADNDILPKRDAYKCSVCVQFIDMVYARIVQADIEHPYQVRTRYRVDEKKMAPYSRSETFLYSLLEPKIRDEWYKQIKFLRSNAPVRLVHKSEGLEDNRLLLNMKATNAAKSVHADMIESHDEALVAAFKNERTSDEVKLDVCVNFLKGSLPSLVSPARHSSR